MYACMYVFVLHEVAPQVAGIFGHRGLEMTLLINKPQQDRRPFLLSKGALTCVCMFMWCQKQSKELVNKILLSVLHTDMPIYILAHTLIACKNNNNFKQRNNNKNNKEKNTFNYLACC